MNKSGWAGHALRSPVGGVSDLERTEVELNWSPELSPSSSGLNPSLSGQQVAWGLLDSPWPTAVQVLELAA